MTALLDVQGLAMHFTKTSGLIRRTKRLVRAVDGVSFDVRPGETLSLVGESGCGKSTTARAILRVYRPTAGRMLYQRRDGSTVDLSTLDDAALSPIHRDIRVVFQDPQGSLNPRLPVLDIVGEALITTGATRGSALEDQVAGLLAKVGLRPEYLHRYPHAFSGGERQRIGIARALITNPRLVIADEAVSALDVSVRAQTINLLQDLQAEFGLTYLFVAHDMSVVRHISTRVAVMYVGRIVELGSVDQVFANPRHPYTEALLSAVPIANPRARRRGARIRLPGEVADPANPPTGCHFHPRCRFATDLCTAQIPPLRTLPDGHQVACHHAELLALSGPDA